MAKKIRHKNRHHLLPKSRGGGDFDENILVFDINKHNSFHHLYENQIITERIWQEVQKDWNVLSDEFKRRLWDLLQIPPQKVYKKSVFSNDNDYLNLKSEFKPINSKKNNEIFSKESLKKIIGKLCNVGNLEKLNKNDFYSCEKLEEITELVLAIKNETNNRISDILKQIRIIKKDKTLKNKRHKRLEIIIRELKEIYDVAS